MKILAIETSCDDTSAAVLDNYKVLSNITLGQSIHSKFGGVVPELASRDHLTNIIKTIDKALYESHLNIKEIDIITYTRGPGLLGGLLIGGCIAKSIAISLKKKILGVNHLKGHVLSPFLNVDPLTVVFPFISLVASGGHTKLIYVTGFDSMKIIGTTLDDAVGEAFDKIGKILGFDYPAGIKIDQFAQTVDQFIFKFPKSQVPDLDMSFSGIKTAFNLFIKKNIISNQNFIKKNKADICASIQHTLISMCTDKLCSAIKKYKVCAISISGGVSANNYLRERCNQIAIDHNIGLYIPEKKYSTDNAAMIGLAGYYSEHTNKTINPIVNLVDPQLSFNE